MSDISSIIRDLNNKWAKGDYGESITWRKLEAQYFFTRQALQAHPEIKAAYLYAKAKLAGGLQGSRERYEELLIEVNILRHEVESYKRQEAGWMIRWQRIAYHIRLDGQNMSLFDKPKPRSTKDVSKSSVDRILARFDKPVPPSGRV
ncbi:protein kinase [Pseudomonas sp. NPDC099000]|uniref:protein kinase n=1 Tax=Pseudomonas sp. NPDC099000 TaxID=3364488 RepID=UPI00383BEC12